MSKDQLRDDQFHRIPNVPGEVSHNFDLTQIEPPKDFEKMCCTVQHISKAELEAAIERELAAEEMHRKYRSICALRAGALFYLLKRTMGAGYTNFWAHCEKRFAVNRATISRKMRLVSKWAATMGASEDQIAELASASDLSDALPSVQLAFTWTEGLDLSDLYRREKLINYGPKGAPPGTDKGHRRTKQAIELEHTRAESAVWFDSVKSLLLEGQTNARWLGLERPALDELSLLLKDLRSALDQFRATKHH